MKTVISVVLSSLFFVTQTIAIAHASEPAAQALQSEDSRLELADQIEAKGAYLQKVFEVDGKKAADQEFDQMISGNLSTFLTKSREAVSRMTEDEAQKELASMKSGIFASGDDSSATESLLAQISDREFSAKEKMARLHAQMNEETFERAISDLKADVDRVGYEASFAKIADRMRDRSYQQVDDGSDAVLILFLILLLAVVLLLIIITPEPTYYVVGGCGGGYVAYRYYYYPY